jgi:hypothetical protein
MLAELQSKLLPQGLSDFQWQTVASTSALSYGAMLGGRTSVVRRMKFPSARGELMVEIEGEPPEWLESIGKSLSEILDLRQGWDSYGAKPISPQCVGAALDILLRVMREDTLPPSVVPTSPGGIQLEWHARGIDLEIEILSPTRVRGLFEDLRTGIEWEADLSFDQTRLTEAIGRLSQPA